MDTRLILVEGCPGSGKSSTAQFLCRQLQQAGHACRWYYEDEVPHPVAVARGVARPRDFKAFGTDVLRRWRDFAGLTGKSDEIVILESHFFQDVITPLRRANVKRERISKLILRMAKFCEPLKPVLLYLHQPDYAATMRRLVEERGPHVEEEYIRNVAQSRYGQRHKLKGFDGLVDGWLDVRGMMEQMMGELSLPMLSIDNSGGDWPAYYQQIGEFLSLPIEAGPKLSTAELAPYTGTYTYKQDTAPRRSGGVMRFEGRNASRRVAGARRPIPLHHQKDTEFTISIEAGELVLRDYGWLWPMTRLVPLERDTFDMRSWPFQLVFERDKKREIMSATRKSETTRWQITGQRYPKLKPAE